MPALQRGSTYATGGGRRGIRWYEGGKRRKQSGFKNDSVAFAWWDAEIAPRLRAGVSTGDVTLREHAERYLAVHAAAPRTKTKLREDLGLPEREPTKPRKRAYKTAIEVFGQRTLRDLEHARGEVAEWVAQLPPTQRQRRVRALRQILNAAVAWDRMLRNPTTAVRVGAVRAPEVVTFTDTAEVDAVAYEIGTPWAQLVVFATETGLRPEEWVALERRDVRGDVVTVQRAYTVPGGLKEYGKTARSRRSVPLSDRALAALDELPPRIDSPLLWPVYSHGGARGRPMHLNLANWRKRVWRPALEAAGLQRDGDLWLPGPYATRHAFATWMLDAGIEAFELSPPDGHLGRDDRQDLRAPR